MVLGFFSNFCSELLSILTIVRTKIRKYPKSVDSIPRTTRKAHGIRQVDAVDISGRVLHEEAPVFPSAEARELRTIVHAVTGEAFGASAEQSGLSFVRDVIKAAQRFVHSARVRKVPS